VGRFQSTSHNREIRISRYLTVQTRIEILIGFQFRGFSRYNFRLRFWIICNLNFQLTKISPPFRISSCISFSISSLIFQGIEQWAMYMYSFSYILYHTSIRFHIYCMIHAFAYTCTYTYLYMHTHTYTHHYACVDVQIDISIYIYMHTCIHRYTYKYAQIHIYIIPYTHIRTRIYMHMYIHIYVYNIYTMSTRIDFTGWRSPMGCLIFVGRFPQISPIISLSSAKRELQYKEAYASTPPLYCICGVDVAW